MLFLDWKMAFDRLDHTALIQSLRRIGVPQHMVEVIEGIYASPSFYATSSSGPEKQGHCSTGIRQGCPLNPYLFDLVLTVLIHDVDLEISSQHTPTNGWSVRYPCYDVEYADDTVLIAVSKSQMQQYFSAVEKIAK